MNLADLKAQAVFYRDRADFYRVNVELSAFYRMMCQSVREDIVRLEAKVFGRPKNERPN